MNILKIAVLTGSLFLLPGCSYLHQKAFMNECVQRPGQEDICQCVWDKLEKDHSSSEIYDAFSGRQRMSRDFAHDVEQAQFACEGSAAYAER